MANLRSATEKDLAHILNIFNEVIKTSTAIYQNKLMTDVEIQKWFNEKTHKSFPILVAEENGEVAGFATYGSFRARECYQSTIEFAVHIKKEYRGKGIGQQLLQNLIEEARKRKYHVMIAGIDSQNLASINLAQKFGFEVCGELKQVAFKFDQWLDLTFMQKRLDSSATPMR